MPTASKRPATAAGKVPPLRRRSQLSDDVADHVRGSIMSGQVKPGEFIRLDETAAALGVSITPVREALLTLRGEGLVHLEPHRGYAVSPLTRTDITDIFWLQGQIAVELAVRAAQRISEDSLKRLEGLLTEMAEAVESGNGDAVTTSVFEFHRSINHISGGTKLAWFLQNALRYTPHRLYASSADWGKQAVSSHEQLVAAMRGRDLDAVRHLVHAQFSDGADRLIQHLDEIGMWDHEES
ncbi:GntR family transcriptional regulator [Hoyosella altamirensis]|uniref:DNA-binding GntR family transcriptional regulator n=1 Tax=Hoyosella altamirensis TaxID=616997 RepID=A0A839RKM5_9ACTN|nr:GntR family transcriptional regulator [Hoyosella altamirensis]MBB3036666.1 DNA-binding GntR family transcriptional regulator [Hoyosella altamirensis]